MSDDETSRFSPVQSVMLVDIPDDLVARCERVTEPLKIMLLKVGHARAASERVMVTRPLVILVRERPSGDILAMLMDRAVATASQVLFLDEVGDLSKLELHLKAAIQAAKRSRSTS